MKALVVRSGSFGLFALAVLLDHGSALAADSLAFSETQKDSLKCVRNVGCTVVTKGSFKVAAVVFSDDPSPATAFGRDTRVSIAIGDWTFAGSLGDDPKYESGGSKATLRRIHRTCDTGGKCKDVVHGKVLLKLAPDGLKVTISAKTGSGLEDSPAAHRYAGFPGAVTDTFGTSLTIDEFVSTTAIAVTGTSAIKTVTKSGGTFDLATVKIKGSPTTPVIPNEQKDQFVAALPVLFVDPPSPAGSSTATVTVNAPGATQIVLTRTGTGCGAISNAQQSGNPLVQTATVGAVGICDLMADVTLPSGSAHYQASFEVEPTALELPALIVEGGFFHVGSLPTPTGGPNAPAIASIDAPGTLLNGSTAELRIQLVDPSEAANITTAFVQVTGAGGVTGYFSVTPVLEGTTLVITITLDPEFAASSAGSRSAEARVAPPPSDLFFQLEFLDLGGDISGPGSKSVPTTHVTKGKVEVTLTWDTPTDLDLHVVEPTGEEIYWGHVTSFHGGTLDTDSNPACIIDGRNVEHITWEEPPNGEYTVRVDFFGGCPKNPANYTVTVNNCGGPPATFTGSFPTGPGDEGQQGSGKVVAKFKANCQPEARVRGRATYEDFAQTSDGLTPTATKLPIRFALVYVVPAQGGLPWGGGVTKQDGTFDVTFSNPNAAKPGYRVEVLANTNRRNFVLPSADVKARVYSVRSDPIDEQMEPDETGVTIEAKADGVAPAFNILDVGESAAAYVRDSLGRKPPVGAWIWKKGQSHCPASSCYSAGDNRIYVRSDPADPDEYDDLVLLHQYGHLLQRRLSFYNDLGGSHTSSARVAPPVAWDEGWATFFATRVKHTSTYLDTTASGIGNRLDIESLDPQIPLGTSDGTQNGDVSPTVVAAMLHDLADDDIVPEARDTIAESRLVFDAFFQLARPAPPDRGVEGVDMVNFLDGWFCRGQDQVGDATSGVTGVLGLHQFSYDFAPLESCR